MNVESFFHSQSNTFTYLLWGQDNTGVIIDSALDFDLFTGEIDTTTVDGILAFVTKKGIAVAWILETHMHADHVSAASYLKVKLGAKIAVSSELQRVRKRFSKLFPLAEAGVQSDPVDRFLQDGDSLDFGEYKLSVISTPGHTPDGLSFYTSGNLFVGDSLFMPDSGTARCDFPDGSAEVLYQSVQKLYQLPADTIVWMCHDYGNKGRVVANRTTIAECKASNIHINATTKVADYITIRQTRDKSLAPPKLLYPSLQLNLLVGKTKIGDGTNLQNIRIPLTHKGGLNA